MVLTHTLRPTQLVADGLHRLPASATLETTQRQIDVCLVNSCTNATRIGWHLWEIDLRFPLGCLKGGCQHAPFSPPPVFVLQPSTCLLQPSKHLFQPSTCLFLEMHPLLGDMCACARILMRARRRYSGTSPIRKRPPP